jgi:hypothetical protein
MKEQGAPEQGNRPELSPWRSDDQYLLGVTMDDAGSVQAVTHSFQVREPHRMVQQYFKVMNLQRLPALPAPKIAFDVSAVLRGPPFGPDSEIVIDQTQVGQDMVDVMVQCGMKRPVRVTLTPGGDEQLNGPYHYDVPRARFISTLKATLHGTGEGSDLYVGRGLQEGPALEAAFNSMNADDDKLDPLVIAVGLTVWRAQRRKPSFGSSRAPPRVRLGYENIKRRHGHPAFGAGDESRTARRRS